MKRLITMSASELIFLFLLSGNQAYSIQTITLNHLDNEQNPSGLIELSHNEEFLIDIINTIPTCFDYNTEGVKPSTAPGEDSSGLSPTTVELDVHHDRQFASYRVTVTPKDLSKAGTSLQKSCNDKGLPKREWVINVTTLGWTVGFAGAFSADRLTDPVFSLRPGKQVSGEGANQTTTDGYFVEEHKDRQDSYRLSSAAMIHLFHTDPKVLPIHFFSFPDLHWAPLSFGLGVGDGSQAHYFLGTSVRFGDQAFLTAGYVFGPKKRLPNGVTNFTTDQNALASLPTQSASAFFVGLSYTFISVSKDTFQNVFKQSTPSSPEFKKKTSGNS